MTSTRRRGCGSSARRGVSIAAAGFRRGSSRSPSIWHRRPPPEPVDPAGIEDATRDGTARGDAALDARRLLDALPEAQRSVVILRYYHDLDEGAVAEILGCPRGTVKSRLHHAMARLAELARP